MSKLYLQVDLICQNRHLVSYRQVPGSIPCRGSIDFFSLFSHIFISFLTRFPFCSTRISKVGKCAALQLWTPTYFSNKHFEALKKVKSRPCTKGWKKQTSNLKLVWWPSYSSRFWTCIYHPRDQLSALQTSFGFPLAPKSISGQKGVEILSCLEGN